MNLPQFHRQPVILRATYHINTPMFVAGENTQEAELTPTAFKGVMRFWWRALNWSKIRLASSNKESALKELHRQEAMLFGIAHNDKNQKQGKPKKSNGQGEVFIKSISHLTSSSENIFGIQKHKQFNKKKGKEEDVYEIKTGLAYLLGQGLYDRKKGILREFLEQEQSFTVELIVTNFYQVDDMVSNVDNMINVLKLIGLLGSFGSRSRHGFGSVTLTELGRKDTFLAEYQPLQFDKNPKTAIKSLLTTYRCKENEELPPLSAFYQGTRIDIVNLTRQDVITHLNQLGLEELCYRSYGRNGKIEIAKNKEGHPIKKDAQQNFWEDHHFILNMLNKLNRDDQDEFQGSKLLHPYRVVFGLPHNYFFSGNSTRGCSANVDSSTGRRASPLIRHIYRAENGELKLIHCLLKSEFLPQGATIDIKAKYQREKPYSSKVVEKADWQVIETFMNRGLFATKETI